MVVPLPQECEYAVGEELVSVGGVPEAMAS